MSAAISSTTTAKTTRLTLGVISGALFALLAYLLMGLPSGPPSTIPYQDKIEHIIAFAGVTGPGLLALSRRYWFFWIAHMVVFGAGTEIFQGLMSAHRQASGWDFLADCVGIAAATLVANYLRRWTFERPNRVLAGRLS